MTVCICIAYLVFPHGSVRLGDTGGTDFVTVGARVGPLWCEKNLLQGAFGSGAPGIKKLRRNRLWRVDARGGVTGYMTGRERKRLLGGTKSNSQSAGGGGGEGRLLLALGRK